MEKKTSRNKLSLNKSAATISNVKNRSVTSVADVSCQTDCRVVTPDMLKYDEQVQKLLQEIVNTYDWLAQVKESPEAVNVNFLDAQIARLTELLAPITHEKFKKYHLAFVCLNELLAFKARHTKLSSTIYDLSFLDDSVTESGDVTFSSSSDRAPNVDLK